jgi:hypothetical protein
LSCFHGCLSSVEGEARQTTGSICPATVGKDSSSMPPANEQVDERKRQVKAPDDHPLTDSKEDVEVTPMPGTAGALYWTW